MTADSNNKKNPFFLPAFIMMLSQVLLIGAATIAVGYMDGYVDGLILELIHLMMIIAAPVATLVLSVAGIVTAIKRKKRIVGCVFCLSVSILEIVFLFILWVEYVKPMRKRTKVTPIQPHYTSISETESISEETDRASGGKTITVTRAAK